MDVYNVFEYKKQIFKHGIHIKMNIVNKDINVKMVHQIKTTSNISSQDSINDILEEKIIILRKLIYVHDICQNLRKQLLISKYHNNRSSGIELMIIDARMC